MSGRYDPVQALGPKDRVADFDRRRTSCRPAGRRERGEEDRALEVGVGDDRPAAVRRSPRAQVEEVVRPALNSQRLRLPCLTGPLEGMAQPVRLIAGPALEEGSVQRPARVLIFGRRIVQQPVRPVHQPVEFLLPGDHLLKNVLCLRPGGVEVGPRGDRCIPGRNCAPRAVRRGNRAMQLCAASIGRAF